MLAKLDVLAQRQQLEPMDTGDASVLTSIDAQVMTASLLLPCSLRNMTC